MDIVFPLTETAQPIVVEMEERPAQAKKNKVSSKIPWNILVVSWKKNKRRQFRKCNAKYAKCHKKRDFRMNMSMLMKEIEKTCDYEKLKGHRRHYFKVRFCFIGQQNMSNHIPP